MQKLYSIIIYLTAFILSLFFIQRTENAWRKGEKWMFRVYSSIAIVIPCLLAALRGTDVGTDTVRMEWIYDCATSSGSFSQYLAWTSMQNLEFGFSFLNYALSKTGMSAQVAYFAYEFLTITPIYYVSKKHMDDYPMWSCIAVFFAFFYNMSFNAVRQCIAIAFIILLYQMVFEKRYIRSVICGALALLFHGSAYVGIVIVLVAVVFGRIKASWFQQIGVFLAFFVVAASPLYIDSIFGFLTNIGLLSERQSFYQALFAGERVIEGSVELSGGGYVAIVLRVLCLALPAIALYKKRLFEQGEVKAVSAVILMGTVMYIFCSIILNTIHIYRITMYPEVFYILYLPYLKGDYQIRRNEFGKRFVTTAGTCVFVALLLIYWYMIFIRYGWHQTNYYYWK